MLSNKKNLVKMLNSKDHGQNCKQPGPWLKC